MNAVVYTRLNCPYAGGIKEMLTRNGISFYESVVGVDVFQESINEMFPAFTNTTVVAIDGQLIGGYNELREWVTNRPQFLTD